MQMAVNSFEVIIIGAGAAGLTAATYLGRFRRRCLVLEDGNSRARWIPTSHNIPGFAAGIGGTELLARLHEQATKYGAIIRSARVTTIATAGRAFAVTTAANEHYESEYLLLATGTRDHLPQIPGAPEAVMRSLLRFCPICDGFEAIDKRIAVVSDGPFGEREALFLTTYSNQVTLLQLGAASGAANGKWTAHGIEAIPITLSDLIIKDHEVSLRTKTGEARSFDALYLALGCSAQNSLAVHLGADCDEHGALSVSAHQETSVPRLYAAGDVVRGLNQVIVAAAEAAVAATDIHNKLRQT
jgi:thioredoxin reductase (NADPH)